MNVKIYIDLSTNYVLLNYSYLNLPGSTETERPDVLSVLYCLGSAQHVLSTQKLKTSTKREFVKTMKFSLSYFVLFVIN